MSTKVKHATKLVGMLVGLNVGLKVGGNEGMLVGGWDGIVVGDIVGGMLGLCVGYWTGVKLGLSVVFFYVCAFSLPPLLWIQIGCMHKAQKIQKGCMHAHTFNTKKQK